MAGISAARTLQAAGYAVKVLEARERIGGRTHTDSSLGVDIDLGAAWIHGPHGNPLTPLAAEHGVTWGYSDFNNDYGDSVMAFDAEGKRLDTPAYTRGGQVYRAALIAMYGSVLYDFPPASVRSSADLLAYGLPGVDVAAMTPDEQKGFYYASVVRPQYEDASDLALCDWRQAKNYLKLPGGDLLLYGGGYKRLVEGLAAGLDIRTGIAVRHIAYDEQGVLVTTPFFSMPADYVVITVPLGVLKSGQIAFAPRLPAEKIGAINRLGFGRYEKMALRFPSIFWPLEPHRFNYVAEGEPELYNAWLNNAHYTGEPVIISYHSGSRAEIINRMSDEEVIDGCLCVLRKMFGPNIPDPVAHVRSGWEMDPYAQGSYSYARVGMKADDRITLGKPVGDKLFFAGEAVHPQVWGTVHGAYETRLLAARRIMAVENVEE